jgi:hypothetical protein
MYERAAMPNAGGTSASSGRKADEEMKSVY